MNYVLPHPDGYLLASLRPEDSDEEHSLRVLLGDDGSIACVYGGGTQPYGTDKNPPEVVVASSVFETVHGLINLAAHLGDEFLSYWGEWECATYLDRLSGVFPSQQYYISGFQDFHPYPRPDYYKETGTSTREMLERPHEVPLP